jgi:superfamily II DNA helicase RecQ
MQHFFHSPPGGERSPQKQLLSAIQAGHSVLASFPLGYPLASFYALSVMLSNGMAVAILPDSRTIHYNLAIFKSAGLRFPDVAFLDGTQMPHEERSIRDAINHHRVRLLYTTPERFSSLTFLELFVRTDVPFLLIEQAERLLPESHDAARYERLRMEGLAAIRHLPPLVLLTAPLRAQCQQTLIQTLGLSEEKRNSLQLIETQLPTEQVTIETALLWSEHQKFERLIATLAGQPSRGRIGRLQQKNPVLIQAGSATKSEKLAASLIDYGFEGVHIVNRRQPPAQQEQVWRLAQEKPDLILVNGDAGTEEWRPPQGSDRQIVYWQPPVSLDSLTRSLFRYVSPEKGKTLPAIFPPKLDSDFLHLEDDDASERAEEPTSDIAVKDNPGYQATRLKGLLLYTREDYSQALQKIRHNQALQPQERQAQSLALRRYRHWILSPNCRLLSLLQLTLDDTDNLLPCGRCDRCQNSPQTPQSQLIQLVQRVLL